MVTRNHNGADTCLTALVDSCLNLGTNRVDHACKTDKDKVVFKCFGSEVRRSGIIIFICAGKNSESLICHSFVVLECGGFYIVRYINYFTADKSIFTLFKDFIGCTLCVLNDTVGRLMNG